MTYERQSWSRGLRGVLRLGVMAFAGTAVFCAGNSAAALAVTSGPAPIRAMGVCPPFPLRDERGAIINPAAGVNQKAPYSPRQTCGAAGCHDYAKITEGFHFTQGKGEKLPAKFAARYNWVSSPGNYGGTWCSPAPLYRQLAPKKNANARTIDMTSYDFVTATCGNCHPGGGPLEYDRDGKRYDERMRDPASGFTSGGANGLDGDYYKARWAETGVIEADCFLCHMPEYDLKKRNTELANLNFRWAATAGAGFGTVNGKVAANEQPTVAYDLSKFDADGNAIVHIAPEPRNEACLGCHFKPDWKKRGAAYSARTDVHLMAGLRCVDCHAAGSRAADPRIRGREIHQFGKGDDPSGMVRNDLDNTVRSCEDCHLKGWRNAPRANHAWLPPLHMQKISCQACHIPNRAVKSALVQASDVYNPAPRISPPPKHIWTFYDQEMAFWNHYGELELFTGKDEPTNVTRPTLIRYKGKIYPANRVHSAWVGFEEQGKPGLNQLFMKDFFQMWTQHRADSTGAYPALSKITDDNGDGIVEVNRPEEIDALLGSVRSYLETTGFPLAGRRLVWVSDSRAYYSSTESHTLEHEEYEATAYASVYKFSHDVAPARAALGAGGCTDCHRAGSPFLEGAVLDAAFGPGDARPRWMPNYRILGLPAFWVKLGAFREGILKPLLYGLVGFMALVALVGGSRRMSLRAHAVREGFLSPRHATRIAWGIIGGGVIVGVVAAMTPGLMEYMTLRRFDLDAKHFWVGIAVLVAAAVILMRGSTPDVAPARTASLLRRIGWWLVGVSALAGVLMVTDLAWLQTPTRLAYTAFDLGITMTAAVMSLLLLLRMLGDPVVPFQSPPRPDGGSDDRTTRDGQQLEHPRGSR